jgi:hypothetical protein
MIAVLRLGLRLVLRLVSNKGQTAATQDVPELTGM